MRLRRTPRRRFARMDTTSRMGTRLRVTDRATPMMGATIAVVNEYVMAKRSELAVCCNSGHNTGAGQILNRTSSSAMGVLGAA